MLNRPNIAGTKVKCFPLTFFHSNNAFRFFTSDIGVLVKDVTIMWDSIFFLKQFMYMLWTQTCKKIKFLNTTDKFDVRIIVLYLEP